MQITIHLDTGSEADLAGLAALVAAIGGQAMRGGRTSIVHADEKAFDTSGSLIPLSEPDDTSRMTASDDGAPDSFDPTERDAEGIPWDDRIHSTPAKTNADGTWRKRRGVDEVLYGKIHAELSEAAGKASPAGASSTGTAQPAGNSLADAPNAQQEDDRPTTGRSAPPPPSVEETARTAPPPPPADDATADTGGFNGFPDFVQKVNVFGHPYVKLNEIAGNVGIAGGFKDMKDHPHLWEMFYDMAQG